MNTILSSILAVFLSVGEWIGDAVTALTPMFWAAETGLTFLGTLAVAGLAFSVASNESERDYIKGALRQ